MELNPRRPAHLHAREVGSARLRSARAEWRRHLHREPPGLLRRLHGRARTDGRTPVTPWEPLAEN